MDEQGQGLDQDRRFYDQEEHAHKSEWSRYDRGSERSPIRRSRSRSPRARSLDRRDERVRRTSERERDGRRLGRDREPFRSRGRNFASKECRVYVTNIPYELKWQELKDIMRKVGDVQYVEMISDNQGHPRGSAVVEFTRGEDATAAVKQLDDFEVLGRKIKVREDQVDDEKYQRQLKQHKENEQTRRQQNIISGSGGGNMSFLNSKNSDPVNSTVFISNLDYKTTWQKVKDVFRRAGNVIRVDIAEDPDKKSKGFGTVVYETPGEALQAVSMFNGYVFGERPVVARLDRDSTIAKVMGAPGGSNQTGVNLGGRVANQPAPSQQQPNSLALLQLQSLAALSALASGAFSNLGALGNQGAGLSGGASTGGLDALGISGLGAGLGGLSSLLSGLGGGLGGGIAGALAGVAGSNALGGHQGGGGGGGGGLGTSASVASKISSGSGRDESGKQIFVRNLPWKVTWQELKDRFRNCGHVVRADIITDERGRSRGCGTVLFEQADEAHIAVSLMNGVKIDGRDIEVRIDRK